MRKKIVIFIVLVVIVATLAVTLTSCNSEMDYVERLYEKGYTYISINYVDHEQDFNNIDIAYPTDLGEYTLITCGTRQMINMMGGYIEIYNDKDTAKARYEELKDFFSEKRVFLDGNAVVYGVEQFVDDAIGK